MRDVSRSYQRWQAEEAAGHDDEADAEFRALMGESLVVHPVPAAFTAQTMLAIAAAATRARKRARRTRAAIVAAGVVGGTTAAYVGVGFGVTVVSGMLTGLLDILIGTVVRIAGAIQTGADAWSVLTSIGRTAASLVADPAVTVTLFALQGVALAALFALQRLLGSDEESLK